MAMNKNNNLFDDDNINENTAKNTDKITKTFTSEIKSVDSEKYIVHAVVSDDSVDRYDEIISAEAWKDLKRYKKHPILVSSHNYGSLTDQIGEAERIWVEDGKLHAEFKYFVGEGNKEADWGFKLAQKGAAAFSVGFIPLKHENEDFKGKSVKVYTSVELLEISQVLIPANAAALQESLNSDDPVIKSLARKVEPILKDYQKDTEIEGLRKQVEKQDAIINDLKSGIVKSIASDAVDNITKILKNKIDSIFKDKEDIAQNNLILAEIKSNTNKLKPKGGS